MTVKCPEDQAEDQTEAIELRNIHVEAGQEEGSKNEQYVCKKTASHLISKTKQNTFQNQKIH